MLHRIIVFESNFLFLYYFFPSSVILMYIVSFLAWIWIPINFCRPICLFLKKSYFQPTDSPPVLSTLLKFPCHLFSFEHGISGGSLLPFIYFLNSSLQPLWTPSFSLKHREVNRTGNNARITLLLGCCTFTNFIQSRTIRTRHWELFQNVEIPGGSSPDS